jgi:hypothetical protein
VKRSNDRLDVLKMKDDVHDEVEGELSGRACGPGQRPPGER